ncbi:DUF1120 domain-containing protein (plasmid) [Enterobacter asburiae]|uniref:DUF1120 domain-containing protein n=1 Tax=Enterobacter asburiae TaxID=61645 RepID=UPI0032AE8948|nr:DUF1120 domain-containing protein [Enterobacter asburiae]
MLNQMQKSITAIAVLAAISLPAMANSVDVRVVGTITPSACTPTVSGNGTFDYGTIKPDTLSDTDFTVLAEKTLDFSIACDAPTKVGFKVTSQRPGSAVAADGSLQEDPTRPVPLFGLPAGNHGAFGLGLNGSKGIGGYGLRLVPDTITADGASVKLIAIDGSNNTITPLGGAIDGGSAWNYTYSFATQTTSVPMTLSTLSAQLSTQAYINKKSELDLTKPVALDGLATIEMVYL